MNLAAILQEEFYSEDCSEILQSRNGGGEGVEAFAARGSSISSVFFTLIFCISFHRTSLPLSLFLRLFCGEKRVLRGLERRNQRSSAKTISRASKTIDPIDVARFRARPVFVIVIGDCTPSKSEKARP